MREQHAEGDEVAMRIITAELWDHRNDWCVELEEPAFTGAAARLKEELQALA